jgi:hypothetical protein
MTVSRRVVLWNLEGVVAVLLSPSGVVYTNQTCGHACMQPEAEGILIPFNNDPPLDDPNSSVCRRLSDLLQGVQWLTLELADQIDFVLAGTPETSCAKVDRTRLKDSHESWVYVDLEAEKSDLLMGFGPVRAVLTWPNSD